MRFIGRLKFSQLSEPLSEIFKQFDRNNDGLLSNEELNDLLINSGFDTLSDQTYNDIINSHCKGKRGVSCEGFLAWQKVQTEIEKSNNCVAKKLLAFGYDACLGKHPTKIKTFQEAIELQKKWNPNMDEQLVQFVNAIWERTGVETRYTDPSAIPPLTESEKKKDYKLLADIPTDEIRLRYSILAFFNMFVTKTLSLIDMSTIKRQPQSLGSRLFSVRFLIFFDNKISFLREILNNTAVSSEQEPPVVFLNRLDASKQLDKGKEDSNCIYLQFLQQLHYLNPSDLRHKGLCFDVRFKGERAQGQFGPYRESLSQLSKELLEQTPPLLIKCPNAEGTGIGENRSSFILNPASKSASFLSMYEFLGKLFGIAIRSKTPLSVDLPSFFWKSIVGEPVTKKDLKDIDLSTFNSYESMRALSGEDFEALYSGAFVFEIQASGGIETIELKEGGQDIMVTKENYHEFVDLAFQKRLQESSKQTEAIINGLSTIVPLTALSLFTSQDAAVLVCGKPEIDLNVSTIHSDFVK